MRINDENQKLEMEERDWNYIMPAYLRSYLFYTKNTPPVEVVFPMFKTVKYGEMTIPVRWIEPDSEEAVAVATNASNVAEASEAEIAQKDVEERPSIAEQVKEITEEVLTPTPEDLLRQQQETIQQLEDDTADKQLEVDTAPKEVSAARAAFAEEPKVEDTTAIEEVPTTPPPPNVVISEATQPPPQPPQPTPEPTAPATNAKPPSPDRPPKLPPVVVPPGQPLDNMHPRDKTDQSRVAKDLAVQKEVDEGKEIEQDVSGLKE